MEKAPLSPTNDFVFKKVFGENAPILADFLKSVLDIPAEEYQGLQVLNPHLSPTTIRDKSPVLDIRIETTTGKMIDVEVQVRRQPSIWQRMQYYVSKMLVERVGRGDEYGRLSRAIGILIADFELVENDAYHNCYRLYDEKTRSRYPDSLEINILEIPKVRGDDGSHLSDWLIFFAARTEEDFMTVSEKSPAIAQAWGIIKVLSEDEESRLVAEAIEKARRDDVDRMQGAYRDGEQKGRQEGERKGRQEGRQEGERKKQLEIARKALRKGLSAVEITELTDLSLSEIGRLAAEL